MKRSYVLLLSVLMFGVINTVSATQPADHIIKNAIADISRFEQQASGLTPARRSNAKRILKLLNLSHERLTHSTNQTDPSWQDVNQRYLTLKTQLEGLQVPSAKNESTSGASAPTPTISPSSKAPRQTPDSVPELVSGQRVRVKKMVKDMMSVKASLVTTGPSTLQDPNKVAARQKRLNQFKEALTRYPQVDDPDVQAARNEFDSLRQALSVEFQRAKGQLTQLGDVQQRLATIEENSRKFGAPVALTPPFSETDAKAWVQAASSGRTVAEHNLRQLGEIAPIAYLPNNRGTPQTGAPYDANDIKRLHNLATSQLKGVETGYQAMAQDFKNRFAQIESDALGRWQEDPNSDKRWLFIGDGQQKEAFQVYADSLAIAQSAAALETALGRQATEALAIIEKVGKGKKEFIRKTKIALETSKLPEPKSKDKKMIAIAQEIVKIPKYKFGKFGKIVLTTSEIIDRERKDSELEIDDAELTLGGDLKMSGTETTWTYKWKEFKFAVPLKETGSDTWHIWWITAKKFSSGGNNTPLNQWISGKATKGNPILKKNM